MNTGPRFKPAGPLAALVYAGAIWALLPTQVVPLNDDFGYYRSVVATIAHGRPWTDDWLEPWSASLSAISSVIYLLTGSFKLATQGLQSGLSGLAFFFLAELFQARRLSAAPSIAATTAVLLFPTLLWKQLEFGGLCLYLPCLAGAIWFHERKRWLGFAVCWCVAIASRQSALAWGALAAFSLVESLRANPKKIPAPEIATLVSGLALFGLMTATMNPTHAQRVADRNFVAHVASLPFLEHLALGGALFLGAAGISLGASPTRDATAFPFSRTGLARAAVALVAMGMALGFCAHRVGVEHEGFHSARGALLLIGLGLPSLVGWLGGGGIRRDYLFCAGACLVVAGLRGITWDYYYLDVVLFALFSAQVAGEDVPSRTPRRLTIAFLKKAAAVVLAITVGTQFALKLKRERDGHAGVITLCEQALRAGSISRADLSLAPFGYAGWHLYPHFVAHDGRERPDIAGFTGYLRPDALMLETRAANDRRPLASPGIILAEGEFPIRWRERHRFMLRRSNSAGQPALPWQEDPAEKDSFPLNDTEWENYIKNARLTVHPELR